MADRILRMNRLFLFTVLLPTIFAVVYYGFMASDIYISESRFVVRSPEREPSTGVSALLQGGGFSRSQEDTFPVYDYVLSRDALQTLEAHFAVSKLFGNADVDFINRFAGLVWWDDSFEALHKYYSRRVRVELDPLSSITILEVSAFSAEDALKINEKLLEMSEELVNQLNERGRYDLIRFAQKEVGIAEQRSKAATLALSKYRNKKGIFDPASQSGLQLQLVSKLQDELIAAKIQLSQIITLTKNNPQIPALQKRVETLQTEIAAETAKVAGGDLSLSNKSVEYERLILERNFADQQLETALASLEHARSEAQRKQLYLERIVLPMKPDIAMEPRRIRGVFVTFALGFVAWGVLTMLVAGVREHQD
jgi:capsular polysaccharide transport system permease protein